MRGLLSRALSPVCCAVLGLCLTGCGGEGAAKTAEVSGTVTLYGKPPVLQGLTITFVGDNAEPVVAEVQPDGTYTAPAVPVGEVRVTLLHVPPPSGAGPVGANPPGPPRPGPPQPPGPPPPPGPPRPPTRGGVPPKGVIPVRYNKPETSKLTCTVEPGKKNLFDVNMTN